MCVLSSRDMKPGYFCTFANHPLRSIFFFFTNKFVRFFALVKYITRPAALQVRFDDNEWYGGTLDKVSEGKVTILYDDGNRERSNYPDPDIVVIATAAPGLCRHALLGTHSTSNHGGGGDRDMDRSGHDREPLTFYGNPLRCGEKAKECFQNALQPNQRSDSELKVLSSVLASRKLYSERAQWLPLSQVRVQSQSKHLHPLFLSVNVKKKKQLAFVCV